jgi:AAA+ ATPase superfamily predicted ATPase
LLEGKNLPTWIREIEDAKKREQTINGLTVNDVFRSQFRFEENAPRAPLQVIDWGLQHVDRLRKASFEAKDKSAKSWQMWLVFGASLLNIVATIISALLKKG